METAHAALHATAAMAAPCRNAPIELIHPRPDLDLDFLPTQEITSPERKAGFEASQDAPVARLLERLPVPAGLFLRRAACDRHATCVDMA